MTYLGELGPYVIYTDGAMYYLAIEGVPNDIPDVIDSDLSLDKLTNRVLISN